LSVTGEEYGEGRILSLVQANEGVEPQKLLDQLFADVREFARGAPQNDDITVMVLRYQA
jgi:serine phosphatase RsbU (regulator of sigma subunit)